jgi:hypothetical protein
MDEVKSKIKSLIKNYENIRSLGRIKEYNEANFGIKKPASSLIPELE